MPLLILRASSARIILSLFPSPSNSSPHTAPFCSSPVFCSTKPSLFNRYLHDRLYFIVEVKQLRVIFFNLSGPVNSSFAFHWVELSFDWSIQEEIRLHLFFILNRLISEGLHKGFSLGCEVLSAIDCSGRRYLKSCIEIDFLSRKRITLSFFLIGSFIVFLGGG